MALRYTHSTDEAKRRAVENLAKPIGPSDESVTNEKGRVAALPKSLILLVEQRGIEPLTSALRIRRPANSLSICLFESCSHRGKSRVLQFFPIRCQRLTVLCCEFCPQIGHKFFTCFGLTIIPTASETTWSVAYSKVPSLLSIAKN